MCLGVCGIWEATSTTSEFGLCIPILLPHHYQVGMECKQWVLPDLQFGESSASCLTNGACFSSINWAFSLTAGCTFKHGSFSKTQGRDSVSRSLSDIPPCWGSLCWGGFPSITMSPSLLAIFCVIFFSHCADVHSVLPHGDLLCV